MSSLARATAPLIGLSEQKEGTKIKTFFFKLNTYEDHPQKKKIYQVSTIDQLKDFILIDYIGNGWSESFLKGHRVLWAPSYSSALLMLAHKRGDILIGSPYVVNFHIDDLKKKYPNKVPMLDKIENGKLSINDNKYHLLIRKSSRNVTLMARFNETLKEIKQDGTFARILNNYY